jgi:energy-coupling factor transporter ATP-binding protein EcfA2
MGGLFCLFLLAESGSGKSTLIKLLINNLNQGTEPYFLKYKTESPLIFLILRYLDQPVYIQSRDPAEFSDFIERIKFLPVDFTVHETSFQSLPSGAFVVLDDFSFQNNNRKQQEKTEFMKIINYYLRHNKITLVLIIHNIYNNNLFNDILLAPHIFLSYSNLGYYLMR